ncbi:hypothetical protein, partial [Haliangium sp. UPWRP_2]|uniref:hypothetical protein n=1 Tax=Haliangium sp. UPWRP_2 TaxID=1931276 RepID=UPI001304F521
VVIPSVAAFFNNRVDTFAAAPLHIREADLLFIRANRKGIDGVGNNAGSRWAGPAFIDFCAVTEIGIVFDAIAVVVKAVPADFFIKTSREIIRSRGAGTDQ